MEELNEHKTRFSFFSFKNQTKTTTATANPELFDCLIRVTLLCNSMELHLHVHHPHHQRESEMYSSQHYTNATSLSNAFLLSSRAPRCDKVSQQHFITNKKGLPVELNGTLLVEKVWSARRIWCRKQRETHYIQQLFSSEDREVHKSIRRLTRSADWSGCRKPQTSSGAGKSSLQRFPVSGRSWAKSSCFVE